MDKADVIDKAKRGDESALTMLLMTHRDFISNVVYRFNWNREESKDVVQNIFIKVIRNIRQFKGDCKFTTWLYRIAVNECIEYNRKAAKQRQIQAGTEDIEEVFAAVGTEDPFAALKDKEIREEINSTLNEMAIDLKTAFCLFYYGGYSGEEGAKAMNITQANFFMKLKKARDTLKKRLTDKGWIKY
jgi:RNA polymerase sigma-70 factor (ECF subfamily)